MSGPFEIEHVRRVYDNQHGACVEVGPDSDGGDWVEIRTSDPKSVEYFGAIRLLMPPQMAALLGAALTSAAADATKETP